MVRPRSESSPSSLARVTFFTGAKPVSLSRFQVSLQFGPVGQCGPKNQVGELVLGIFRHHFLQKISGFPHLVLLVEFQPLPAVRVIFVDSGSSLGRGRPGRGLGKGRQDEEAHQN